MKNFLFFIVAMLFISNLELDAQRNRHRDRHNDRYHDSHDDRHRDRRHSKKHRKHHPHIVGNIVPFLPGAFTIQVIRGHSYYRSNGNYYSRRSSGFECVGPPNQGNYCAPEVRIPYDACEIRTSCGDYWISRGLFYQKEWNGVRIVDPPIRAIIYDLPRGYISRSYRGHTYMESHGVFFRPSSGGSCGRYASFEILEGCPIAHHLF